MVASRNGRKSSAAKAAAARANRKKGGRPRKKVLEPGDSTDVCNLVWELACLR